MQKHVILVPGRKLLSQCISDTSPLPLSTNRWRALVRQRAATMDKSHISPFALLFLFVCNIALGCNTGWTFSQGKCYKFISTAQDDIRMARRYCLVYRADLAYIDQNSTFIMTFDPTKKYWVKEDSKTTNETTIAPGCPYIFERKLDYTDCGGALHYICERPDEHDEQGCPLGWLLYDSKCYKTVKQPKNYTESLSICSSGGGQLAVLDDEAKEQNAHAVIIGDDDVFLVDATRENETFQWSSGKPFSPVCSTCSNFTSKGNCLGIKSSSSHPTMFQWDDVNCSANNSFLCERAAFEKTITTTTPHSSTEAPRRKLCPIGYNWKSYSDTNYCFWETTYETERLNWYQARQFCQAYGGDLATYRSSEEEDHGLGGAKGHYKGLWFGLRRGKDDVFRWVDGITLNYTNWKYGEPHLLSYKYCGSHAAGSGRWELDYCGVRRWFVCKAPKTEVPTLPEIKFQKKMCNMTTFSTFHSWYLYDNHCYLLNDNPKYSWDLAQKFCKDNDGHLASIHSFNETDFILSVGDIVASSEYWIGLSAKGLGSSYTWSDGTPLDFLYWNDDSSINQTERVNTCVAFNQQRGFWSTSHCNRIQGVICKRGLNSSYDFPTQEPTPVLPGNCEEGWYLLGNLCYKVFGKKWTQRQTWENAQHRCENESASLASIHNEEQQNFLTDLMLEVDNDAWIGLKYNQRENLFEWVDETALDFTDWDVDEPSFTDDDEDSFRYRSVYKRSCIKLNYGRNNMGKWHDVNCAQNNAFICQKTKDPSIAKPSEDPFSCSNKTGWSRLGSSCFRIFEEKTEQLSWTAAQSKCKSYGADLTNFKNSAVAVFLSKRITQKNEFFWIGVREVEKGKYVSLHNKRLTHSNWLPRQPLRISTMMDNCVAMNSEAKWMVRSCRENQSYVCEWNSEDEKQVIVDESHLCPKIQGWIDIGGDMCIKTFLLQKFWNEAMLYCLQHGGSLVTFHSSQDLHLFINYVNSYFRFTSVHIGLARRKDGSYMWVDFSPLDFEAWDPDDPESVSRDCAELDMRSEKWNKISCDSVKRNFFCSASKQRDSNEALASNSTRTDDMINQKLAIGGIFGIVICLIVVVTIISLTVYYLCPIRQVRSKLLIPDAQ